MTIIKRDERGNHTVGGKPFTPNVELYRKTVPVRAVQMNEAFSVETLEGTMEGKADDWLMVGINGEMYPCDNEIFLKTYELIEHAVA